MIDRGDVAVADDEIADLDGRHPTTLLRVRAGTCSLDGGLPSSGVDVLALLDELQSIARTGLHYAAGPHDRERYERLNELVTMAYADLTPVTPGELSDRFAAEIGYITAKVGVQAALFDERERVLLVRRADDGSWCVPAGFLDPNEAPDEGALREVMEEAGYEAVLHGVSSVLSRLASPSHGPHSMVVITYHGEVTGGSGEAPVHEVTESGWFAVDDETVEWHLDHKERVLEALARHREHLESEEGPRRSVG